MYSDERRPSLENQRPVVELIARVDFRLRKGLVEKSVSYSAIFDNERVSISHEEYRKPYEHDVAKKYFDWEKDVEYSYRAY